MLANAETVYHEHYTAIRAKVPRERLLEFRLGEGWKPLCEFLGKDVPETEFPRINDAKDFQRKVDETIQQYIRSAIKALILPSVILVGAVAAWWSYSA